MQQLSLPLPGGQLTVTAAALLPVPPKIYLRDPTNILNKWIDSLPCCGGLHKYGFFARELVIAHQYDLREILLDA